MKYRKIKEPAYNIHFIKTDKFKKIRIKVNFKEEIKKESIVYRNMLSLILFESSNKYKTKRLLDIECEELYNVNISSHTSQSGNYQILTFDSVFLNEKYTEPNMNEKSLEFFLDLIMNPDIENNMFNEKSFNNAKRILKEDIDSYFDVPSRLALTSLYENMCKDTPLSYRGVGYIEDLNDMTRESLYEYYKNMIKTNLIDIFVVGDYEDKKIEEIIKRNFKINTIKKQSKSHIITYSKFRKIPKTIMQKKELNQSVLAIGAKLKDITEFERLYVLAIYNTILGGSPDSKLFKEVREKNSLCYGISSTYSGIGSVEIISAGINEKDFKKCLSLIKKEMKKMNNGDFSEEEINQAKTTYLASLKEIEDTQSSMIAIYEAHEYLNYDLIEDRIKNIKKVTKEMIIELSYKIKLDTIYLLGGTTDEGNK